MTKQEFEAEFGTEYRKLARKPIFAALLTVLDEESPAKKPPTAEGDKLHGAPVFLNHIYGWEDMRKFLVRLSEKPEDEKQIPDSFDTPEV